MKAAPSFVHILPNGAKVVSDVALSLSEWADIDRQCREIELARAGAAISSTNYMVLAAGEQP